MIDRGILYRSSTASADFNLNSSCAVSWGAFSSSHSFSLGGVLLGFSLGRVAYLGLVSLWDDLPNVAQYFDALVKRLSQYKEAMQATPLRCRNLPAISPHIGGESPPT